MQRIHLANALVRSGGAVLLVASRYANQAQPLWNLPGGRQSAGELLAQTAVRELREETGLDGEITHCCYLSESYDGDVHITSVTFALNAHGTPAMQDRDGDHVVDLAWVPIAELEERLVVRVVREPLLDYLRGTSTGYAGYAQAGITIEFPPDR